MNLKLKPEQEKLIERAARYGMSPDEVLDQAFAVIQEQHRSQDWMPEERDAIAAHVAEGFAQSERSELVSSAEAVRILEERRKQRQIA